MIVCSNVGLTKMFSAEDWAPFNDTKDEYEVLKFDNNLLEEIDVPFPAMKISVKVIDFRHNNIKKIAKKTFAELSSLEEIDLSFNELTTEKLTPDVFEGKYSGAEYEPLKALRKLVLSNNLLHSLHVEIFDHTQHLHELYLNDNPFQIIHPNVMSAFGYITQLQKLDMSRMELNSLPEPIFHSLRALKVLNLAGNLFTKIPEALKYAVNVRELSLDENPIHDLSEHNSMPKMLKLEKLNMTYMDSLVVIGRSSLSGLESLKELRLNHNHKLSYIHSDAFVFPEKDDPTRPQWPLLEKLFLDNNNLTGLDSNLFPNWQRMTEIHLHDNPW
jgi:Leucine-rich repeat (LRR) protein